MTRRGVRRFTVAVALTLVAASLGALGLASADPVDVLVSSGQKDVCGSTSSGQTCMHREWQTVTVVAPNSTVTLSYFEEDVTGFDRSPTGNSWNENTTVVGVSGNADPAGTTLAFSQVFTLERYHSEQPSNGAAHDRIKLGSSTSAARNGQNAGSISRAAEASCTQQNDFNRCVFTLAALNPIGVDCIAPGPILAQDVEVVADCVVRDYGRALFPTTFTFLP